jgi:hypothetical protein
MVYTSIAIMASRGSANRRCPESFLAMGINRRFSRSATEQPIHRQTEQGCKAGTIGTIDQDMSEARMFARTKIALATIMALGVTAATLAHEGKSIVDQYGDDANYEYFPDYPAASLVPLPRGGETAPNAPRGRRALVHAATRYLRRYRREPHR